MVKPPTPKPSIIALAEGNSARDVKLQKIKTGKLGSVHVVVTLQLEIADYVDC